MLEVKMFYKSQEEVAKALNTLIDSYWNNEVNEAFMLTNVGNLIQNNRSKILKDTDFTSILKQKCGKRRLEVVARLLEITQ
ncbi:TIGR04540 family protein [Paenibacillus sp. USHLN196]|uniref:TIGR04540 family protein n=1 Tax=Paenibacillus sp. USHLN196 TaxID=3081291 RepID=UPI003018E080